MSSRSGVDSTGASQQSTSSVSDRWIVRLTPQATLQAGSVQGVAALFDSTGSGLSVVRGLGLPGQVLLEAAGQSPAVVEAALRASPYVGYFASDMPIYGQADPVWPDDPQWQEQWGLHNVSQTGGAYDADIDKAKEAIIKIAKELDWTLHDPAPKVVVKNFGDSSVDLEARIWIQDARKRMDTISYISDNVKKAFDEAGIEIPYPKRDIIITNRSKQ